MLAAPALQQTHAGLRPGELDPNDINQPTPLNRTVRWLPASNTVSRFGTSTKPLIPSLNGSSVPFRNLAKSAR